MEKKDLIKVISLMAVVFLMITVICIAANAPKTEADAEPTVTEATEATDIVPEPTETIHIEEPEPVPEVTEAPVPPVTEEVEPEPTYPEFDTSVHKDGEYSDLYLLAMIIYQEAGGSSCNDCRRRVADVVLNRVAHPKYPDTIEKVLTQYGQYGTLYKKGIKWPKRAAYANEKKAVERAYRIAQEVLDGQHSDVYGEGYVYQAEFKQGKSGFWHCGHYFGKR